MKKQLTVITGGSSGLGLAAARCLAGETSLLICGRNTDSLKKAKKELESFGADVNICQLDVSDAASVEECAKYAASLGDVVNLIHTAGVSPANTSAEDIVQINAVGTVYVVQAFYPIMAEGGVAILFSSTGGYFFDTSEELAPIYPVAKDIYTHWAEEDFGAQLLSFLTNTMGVQGPMRAGSAYCLTKNFVRHFVYSNTVRFARKGCRILSVSPGSYLTRMHQALIDNQPEQAASVMETIPVKRWGHAYEMGKLVQFLCSKGAGYITGVDILADGGCTYSGTVAQVD